MVVSCTASLLSPVIRCQLYSGRIRNEIRIVGYEQSVLECCGSQTGCCKAVPKRPDEGWDGGCCTEDLLWGLQLTESFPGMEV
jgi:hypothetical protein